MFKVIKSVYKLLKLLKKQEQGHKELKKRLEGVDDQDEIVKILEKYKKET